MNFHFINDDLSQVACLTTDGGDEGKIRVLHPEGRWSEHGPKEEVFFAIRSKQGWSAITPEIYHQYTLMNGYINALISNRSKKIK